MISKRKKMRQLLDNPPESINEDQSQSDCSVSQTTELEEIKSNIIIDTSDFGDTPGKLMKYSMISAEQGGIEEYHSVLNEAKNDAFAEFRPKKGHACRLLTLLAPGCLAMGFSMSYASQAHSLL